MNFLILSLMSGGVMGVLRYYLYKVGDAFILIVLGSMVIISHYQRNSLIH